MQLIHNSEQLHIENNESTINIIFKKINELLQQKDIVFSHLIIDGTEVYENHEEYIKEHPNEISEIEIATRNIKEIIWETMESIHEYLQRAIPALTKLVDDSYDNFSSKSWEGINQLAEGMQWMMQFASLTKSASQQPANWVKLESSLKNCENNFQPLLEAVEMQDTILILDILTYEVTPAYEALEKQITEALIDEEFLKNVN
ncbi:hypothetical protein CUC15_16560 [Oceanobacillus zhaokaii]|uniref:Uncharacterized protein n=1 Tax=Oceanobacillus zhaokaii TaxID=2052660 RepID=A0A345PKB5_9BACI|nr:hypothetical protein [Oceanobacillus zhaokaii]AXI10445.1 hypothetical protein CUC15_16560 [Oceanobacillus zhaokaii]